MLPPEVEPGHLAAPEHLPELVFCLSRQGALLSRKRLEAFPQLRARPPLARPVPVCALLCGPPLRNRRGGGGSRGGGGLGGEGGGGGGGAGGGVVASLKARPLPLWRPAASPRRPAPPPASRSRRRRPPPRRPPAAARCAA